MKPQINMVGIITSKFDELVSFYSEVMGFPVKQKMEGYAEFENQGVRFAISTNDVMGKATGHSSYSEDRKGQSLELAFKVDSPEDVDSTYKNLVDKGAGAVKDPEDLPWNQRAAFFSDPDGNIHEIFADL